MKTDNRTADFVYRDYFNFNLSAQSLLNLAGILSNGERNRYMSQPQPKIDTRASAPAGTPAKPRDNTPKPLAVTGVMTRRPSPVHGLQSNVERAFAAPVAAGERKIPFAVTLAGVSVFSLACWTLLYFLIRAV